MAIAIAMAAILATAGPSPNSSIPFPTGPSLFLVFLISFPMLLLLSCFIFLPTIIAHMISHYTTPSISILLEIYLVDRLITCVFPNNLPNFHLIIEYLALAESQSYVATSSIICYSSSSPDFLYFPQIHSEYLHSHTHNSSNGDGLMVNVHTLNFFLLKYKHTYVVEMVTHPHPSSPIKIIKVYATAAAVLPRFHNTITFGGRSCTTAGLLSSIKAVDVQITALQQEDNVNVSRIKQHLFAALQGINRGIFGVPTPKKTQIQTLVELLESQNPTPEPTLCLEKVAGAWKLIYSTITILGSKRTKLGLRDFINLGDFIQLINVPEGKAVNVIEFSAKGLTLLSGQLTIDASFKIASNSRVDINYQNSVITPDQLMNVFRKNYDLLLEIFNPNGWLEITYVDDSLRIGRDDKGNIFILERVISG